MKGLYPENIGMDEKLTFFIENNRKCLKGNESVMYNDNMMESVLEDVTFYAVHIMLAVISILSYFFLRKKLWGTQDSCNQQKESHKDKRDPTFEPDHPINEDGSSMLSMFTYSWVEPLLRKGSSQVGLTSKDMFTMPNSLNVKAVQEKFSKLLQQAETSIKKPTLLRALYKAYGFDFLFKCGLLELFVQVIDFTGPISLKMLISYFENQDEPAYMGYCYASLLFLSGFGKTLLECTFQYSRNRVILKARISIMTTIYQKALRISTASLSKFSTGEIVNFLGIDTDRFLRSFYRFHTLWSLPVEFLICVSILYQLVGIAFVGAMVVAMSIIPFNKILSTKQMVLAKVLMKQKDKRTKMIHEVLGGIKAIKLNTWEDHFWKTIDKLRNAELNTIRQKKILAALSVMLWIVTPTLMTVLTFSVYTMMGNTLTTAKLFACIALFLKLIGSLNDIPWTLTVVMEAVISLKRIEQFVALDDINLNKYYGCTQESKKPESVVCVNAATFTWEGGNPRSIESKSTHLNRSDDATTNSGIPTLRDISVNITKGKFIGVTGKVGSGKSSLLNAIMAEMARKDGQIYVSNIKNGFALADQEPWIQRETVRDNITFGSPFNAKKYAEVLVAASLKKDMEILPAGDRTEVGENGVTLSGGQKARLALARALYKDKDIYLLDDPLAAVDAHVAQHLYDRCIMGLLRTKTRILCTHHTKFLGKADLVIVMDDGVITKMGPPGDILSDIKFAEHNPPVNDAETGCTENKDKDGKMKAETKATGRVKLRVYKTYLAAIDKWVAPVILLCFFFQQTFQKMQNWWLAHWVNVTSIVNTNASFTGQLCFHDNMSTPYSFDQYYDTSAAVTLHQPSLTYYMAMFVCIASVYAFSVVTREFLFVYAGTVVARTMHTNLLNIILKAPMAFYDVTPVGRILNRFSADMDTIDNTITNVISLSVAKSFNIFASVFVACYGLPRFILILVPVFFFYYHIQAKYRHTSREVRRISSLNRSPIFSHFSETVSGVITIRAFRETERFKDQHVSRVDNWLRAVYTSQNIGLWLLFRTQTIGTVIGTGIALLAVIQHNNFSIDPGIAGLAISYTLALSLHLNRIVNSVTEMEKEMISVERVQQYIEETPSERWKGLKPSPSWPATGVISYSDVHMKYRDGLPNVLKGLTFTTRDAEKVGIVGRTGSGKSSLFQTLFRTVEISSGEITIDGVDIQQLDLKDVRRHLAVIPQDPFLFSGSVRENLDPTSCYSDEELWGVLDRCHLRLPVDRLGGLEGEVTEKGRCFSVGQKQLMCLARALLTKAKVLCIDEATASVDLETDMLIQETIRQEFVNSTVLTIAHRINTIMDSDRVLVMDQGQVAELDSPENLLKNPQSAFYKMVHGENSRKNL